MENIHTLREARIDQRLMIDEEMIMLRGIGEALNYLAMVTEDAKDRPTARETAGLLRLVQAAIEKVEDGIEAEV